MDLLSRRESRAGQLLLRMLRREEEAIKPLWNPEHKTLIGLIETPYCGATFQRECKNLLYDQLHEMTSTHVYRYLAAPVNKCFRNIGEENDAIFFRSNEFVYYSWMY